MLVFALKDDQTEGSDIAVNPVKHIYCIATVASGSEALKHFMLNYAQPISIKIYWQIILGEWKHLIIMVSLSLETARVKEKLAKAIGSQGENSTSRASIIRPALEEIEKL